MLYCPLHEPIVGPAAWAGQYCGTIHKSRGRYDRKREQQDVDTRRPAS